MNNFVYEDGQGNLFNDKGMAVAVVEMEVDEEMYPIETVTNFGMYPELKPPEKPEKNNERNKTEEIYKEVEKEQLFALFYEKGMSAREAALKLHITPRTAQRWIANDQRDPQTYTARKEGRPAIMDDRHKTHLVDLIDEEPALVLGQMMDSLTAEFIDLEISKTALYNFVTKECKISLKRAHFHSVERNCLEKITARKEWRSIAWSKVGTRAVVKIPKTRAKTTTILGATCALGVVDIKVRRPQVMPTSKKRKTAGSSGQAQTQSKGTVTGHYFNFISDIMDEMDKHPEIFKDEEVATAII
ncbi:conserved hypothetical protein, partial [Mucor ambiguus]